MLGLGVERRRPPRRSPRLSPHAVCRILPRSCGARRALVMRNVGPRRSVLYSVSSASSSPPEFVSPDAPGRWAAAFASPSMAAGTQEAVADEGRELRAHGWSRPWERSPAGAVPRPWHGVPSQGLRRFAKEASCGRHGHVRPGCGRSRFAFRRAGALPRCARIVRAAQSRRRRSVTARAPSHSRRGAARRLGGRRPSSWPGGSYVRDGQSGHGQFPLAVPQTARFRLRT